MAVGILACRNELGLCRVKESELSRWNAMSLNLKGTGSYSSVGSPAKLGSRDEQFTAGISPRKIAKD